MKKFYDMNVLIVDDEVEIRTILKHFLSQLEVKIFEATGANEAYAILNKNKIDLTILDINLPVISGLEILKEINQKYPNTVNLILSGYGDKNNVITALKYKVFDFLEKPIDKEFFLQRVKNGLTLKYQKDLITMAVREFVIKSCNIGSYEEFDSLDDDGKNKVLETGLGIMRMRQLRDNSESNKNPK